MTSQSIAAEINIRCFWVLGDRQADMDLLGAGRPTSRLDYWQLGHQGALYLHKDQAVRSTCNK